MVPAAFAPPPARGAQPDHAPTATASPTHLTRADAWAESKHRHAMQPATAQTVLGDFGEAAPAKSASARCGGGASSAAAATSWSPRRARRPHAGARGQPRLRHPAAAAGAAAAAGRTPARPSRSPGIPRARPGSRCTPTARSPGRQPALERRYQNWNLMCGECHTTATARATTTRHDRYATTWAEANVGCQACHAPAARTPSARKLAAAGERARRRCPPRTGRSPARTPRSTSAPPATRAAPGWSRTPWPGALFDQFIPDNLRPRPLPRRRPAARRGLRVRLLPPEPHTQAGVAQNRLPRPHRGRLRADGNAPVHRLPQSRARPRSFPRPAGEGLRRALASLPLRRRHGRPSVSTATCRAATTWSCIRAAITPSGAAPRPGAHCARLTPAPAATPTAALSGPPRDRAPPRQRIASAPLRRDPRRRIAGAPGAAGAWLRSLTTPLCPIIKARARSSSSPSSTPGVVPVAEAARSRPLLRTSATGRLRAAPLPRSASRSSPPLADPVRAVRIAARARSPTCHNRARARVAGPASAPRWRVRRGTAGDGRRRTLQLNLAGLASRNAIRSWRNGSACAARCSANPRSTAHASAWLRCSRRPAARTRSSACCATGSPAPPVPASFHLALGLLAGQRQR